MEQSLGEEASLGLSLKQQLDLVSNSSSVDGIKQFGDALVKGELSKVMPLNLTNGAQYRTAEFTGEPYVHEDTVSYKLEHQQYDPSAHKEIEIIVSTPEDAAEEIRIRGKHTPGMKLDSILEPNKNKGNNGLHVELWYRFIDGVDEQTVQLDHSLIYVQTTTDVAYENAVVVVNADGTVEDVLPPGDYHAERLYGADIRKGEELAKNRELPLAAIHELDQLEGAQEQSGDKLKHQRVVGEYASLQQDVAQVLGIPIEQLFSSKIDPVATFEASLNSDLKTRPVQHGEGESSVPPIVFK